MTLEKNPRVGEACVYETELELKQVKYIEELEKANNELREKLGESAKDSDRPFRNPINEISRGVIVYFVSTIGELASAVKDSEAARKYESSSVWERVLIE